MGNRINKLEKRMKEAQARRDYAKAACLMQQLQQARQAAEAEEHFADVVEAVEEKTMYNMANVVANTVRERIGIL